MGLSKVEKHEIIRKTFESSGCELLSEISLSKTMQYRCSCGQLSQIHWYNFKNGERCRECSFVKSKDNNPKRRAVAKMIHEYFQQNDCVLLETEYVNQTTPMKYICECGNTSTITWKSFRRGYRCKVCADMKIKNRFIPKGETHFRWNPDRGVVNLNRSVRSRAKNLLKRTLFGQMKDQTTFKMLGYTKEQLIHHITSQFNWIAIQHLDWEIDHIFPITAFTEYQIYDTKIINCLSNLGLLTSKNNKTKNNRYDRADFERWLTTKGVSFVSQVT